MLYRLRIDLCFDKETVSRAIYEKIKFDLSKAVKLTASENEISEKSYIELHKCYHDENSRKPCEVLSRIEV